VASTQVPWQLSEQLLHVLCVCVRASAARWASGEQAAADKATIYGSYRCSWVASGTCPGSFLSSCCMFGVRGSAARWASGEQAGVD
jgi:hypothetical protein